MRGGKFKLRCWQYFTASGGKHYSTSRIGLGKAAAPKLFSPVGCRVVRRQLSRLADLNKFLYCCGSDVKGRIRQTSLRVGLAVSNSKLRHEGRPPTPWSESDGACRAGSSSLLLAGLCLLSGLERSNLPLSLCESPRQGARALQSLGNATAVKVSGVAPSQTVLPATACASSFCPSCS